MIRSPVAGSGPLKLATFPVSSARLMSMVSGDVPAVRPRVEVSIRPDTLRNWSSMTSLSSKLATYSEAAL